MRLFRLLPGTIEKLLFRSRRSGTTEAASFISLNLILILGVFFILLNNVVYDWTGTMYTHGFHLNTSLDDAIPFAPAWAVFYLYLFYPLSAVTMLYFCFIEYKAGYALAWSLVLINLISDVVYILFPVTTDIYRATLLANPMVGNPLASAMYRHYAADPSFNCFPSLHAAVSVICFYAWYRYARVRPNRITGTIAVGMAIVALGVVLSTLFVKQHYIADEIAGILLAWGIGAWVYGKKGVLAERE